MRLEQAARLDGSLVTAADQDHAAACGRGWVRWGTNRAISGPARAASLDQPADSRMLAKSIGPARPASAAASENRAASCVQPTVRGVSFAAIARKRSSSARQRWGAVVGSPRQPRRTAPPSSGIVSSHEQIRRCLVASVIALTISCNPTAAATGRNPGKVYTAWIEKRDAGVADGYRLHPARLLANWKCRCRQAPTRSDCGRTKAVKLLRTIRLDASDLFVFEKAAEPGEWAVSGAFAFAACDPAQLRGKARTAFRAGFLGLQSLGRSTLAQIVEASEPDYRAVVDLLAAQLVAHFGAPDLAAARLAAEEEAGFVASLCDQPPGVLVAGTRSHENGTIREAFRTLRPRDGAGHARAFEFMEVVGEDDVPGEHLDLASLRKGTGG